MKFTNAESIAADSDFLDRLTTLRRDIHRHPETAFEEVRTSDLVANFLAGLGMEIHRGLGKTGVVGTLKGRQEGPRSIGLRADMDALFIREATGKPYASSVEGKMHACGHDGHTTMLLGAAAKLAADPDFAGTVHFIFQPAEEGLGGGRVMIEDGLFMRFPCDAIYGVHNGPKVPLGNIITRPGPLAAAGDTWEVVFEGTGGHGAGPHVGTDPTVAAGHFLVGLSSIISRNVAASDTAVLSVGHIQAGDYQSPNIIPAKVVIRGTARSYTTVVRDTFERRLGELASGVAAAQGVTAKLIYTRRYPPLVNAAEQTALAVKAAQATVGAENVDGDCPPLPFSEDFSFMLEKVPGAYVAIGNGDGRGTHFVHTPEFDFNDAAIPFGVAYWINVVAAELAGAEA
jgi:amidohydrolase